MVELTANVITLMAQHRQLRFWHRERGGLLFAPSIGASDGRVVLADASPPHSRDRSGRMWLELDHRRCIEEIRDRFARGLHFVGYWHTHPERFPRLSSQDAVALRPLVDDPGIDLVRLIMIVIGNSRENLAFDVAVFDRRNGSIESMFPMEREEIEDCHHVNESCSAAADRKVF
jgi:hypothetical protein